jgi:GntR family transcriptional regulator, transcriptional repressor for pyruvate dehydrogenase complex
MAPPASRPAPAETLFLPVRTRKTFQDVVRQVVELIRAGELREGDELPGERRLAAAMEVSRPTIRLAVSALVEAGVVEVSPGRGGGMRIKSQWIPDTLLDSAVEPPVDEAFELLEARRTLEPRVAQLAAVRGREEHFASMQQAIDLQRAHIDDHRKALQAELMFHRVLWKAAGNPALEEMLIALFHRLETILDMAMRTLTDQDAAVAINSRTLEAVRRGEFDGVEAAMDEHMSYLEQITEDAFGRRRIRSIPDFLRGPHSDTPGKRA